jgi:hypothetical protein
VAAQVIPPLPAGFELVKPQRAAPPPLPAGFAMPGQQPPPREVGFMESAGRTAASAAIPIVRGLDMAAAGLAGMLAPLFGLDPAKEQERIFSDADQRSATMRQQYQPQPGEEFSLPGQIAGGLASLPVEMAGGLGMARGLERSADVLQRGGTMGEADTAGLITGGANLAANLLPIKLGGAAGRAVERTMGGGRAAAVGAGAATGGALGVGGDIAVVGAENAALPTGDQFADLQQEADPAVSGGLGLALGALGGAMGAPQPRVRRAKTTPGTQGSAGAAGTDVAAQRRARAESLPVPVALTEGQATRSFEQQRFERETAKDVDSGAGLRERAADQNERVLKNFDSLVEQTGAEQVDKGSAGRAIVDPIIAKAEKAKAEIREAYDDARMAGEMEEAVDTAPIAKFIDDNRSSARNAGVLGVAEDELIRLGGAFKADGSLEPGQITLNDLEELRKTIVAGGKKDATNAEFARQLRAVIDQATEGAGGELYKAARSKYAAYAKEFKEQGAIRDLIFLKKNSSDRITAFEDVLKRTVLSGTTDDLKNVQRTLTTAGEKGVQAWKEVQGQTLQWLRDEATKNVNRDIRGNAIVSPAGLGKAIRTLDQEGKLDLLFGKKGAETLRDLDEITKDLFTAPPGAVNTSNTASVVGKMLADMAVSGTITGIPAPLVTMGRAARDAVRNRKTRAQVQKALGPEAKEPLFRQVIETPEVKPDPEPPIPAGKSFEVRPPSGKAPILAKLPVGKAVELTPKPAERVPVGEAVELKAEKPPTAPLPAGIARELDDTEFSAWSRDFGLGDQSVADTLRIDRALQQDAEAVERAAVQHAKQPVAFARAINRILEKQDETVTAAPPEGGQGLPGPRGSEEGGQQGQRVGQEDAAAQAQEVAALAAALKARDEFEKVDRASVKVEDGARYFELSAAASDAAKRFATALASRPDEGFALRGTTSDGRQAMLNASAQQPGKWQLTRFDRQGEPWGDTQYETKAQAVKEFVDEVRLESIEDMRGKLAPKPEPSDFDRATEPTGNPITDRLSAKMRADYQAVVREYDALPDSRGGTVLNTDTARELSPDYLKDRTRSADVHEPASAFIKRLYAEKLAGPTPEGYERRVMFTAGGTGAGKTTGVQAMPVGNPEIVYDTNMNGMASAVKKIDQALEAGREARIAYVYADPLVAFEQAMGRAMRQKGDYGSGRTVPIVEHVNTHVGAAKVVRELVDKYRNDLRVNFFFIDNSRGRGKQAVVELRDLPLVGDNGLRERLEAAAKEALESGRIDQATYAGFLGTPARPAGEREGVRRVLRPRDAGSHQEVTPPPTKKVSGATGSTTSVVTERGLRVPVRYRLVEMGELTTSHTDDLKENPAFAQEFQPRDRSRADSEAQITRIQNGLQPDLLADSPKASDGAPIIGPDGLVESGNARTIALRRAYGTGKADGYREWMAENAERFGLTADQVKAAKMPVLVRERTVDVDRAEFARQANESPVASMSETEVAVADAKRLPDLEGLIPNDDGTINLYRSIDFIRDFMRTVAAPNERGQLMTADGKLSQRGAARIRNAVFAKAYGDSDLVAMMAESADGNVRNVVSGLLRAAPAVAKVRELAEAGARSDAQFVPDLIDAVRRFSDAREAGQKVSEYLSQGSLIGGEAPSRVADMMRQLEIDSRAPRRIAEMVEGLAGKVDAAGDPRQTSLLGGD